LRVHFLEEFLSPGFFLVFEDFRVNEDAEAID
jgi:hypothetical protein